MPTGMNAMPMMKNDGNTVPAVSIGCHAGSRCCLNAEPEGRFDFTLFSTTSLPGILTSLNVPIDDDHQIKCYRSTVFFFLVLFPCFSGQMSTGTLLPPLYYRFDYSHNLRLQLFSLLPLSLYVSK